MKMADEKSDKMSMIVFSGDMDKVMAGFILATGAAAMGTDVTMFFTFWGLSAIKKNAISDGKNIMEKMMGWMLPKNIGGLGLSKMNMGGMGRWMMNRMMKSKKVASLPELLETARELGIKLVACKMSMDVMGIKQEELIDPDMPVAGVASFLESASDSKVSLFI
jgi:peroxiredoxin family protein